MTLHLGEDLIPRYEHQDIASIWSDSKKFSYFLTVELSLLEALEERSIAPVGSAKKIRDSVEIRPDRIDEIEREVHHDIIAFCTSITEQVDPEVARFFHYGATSSDIIDTAFSLQIRDSLEIVLKELEGLIDSLRDLAQRTSSVLCVGRSHGISAEPMMMGQKWMGHLAEFERLAEDYRLILAEKLTGQYSGAIGSYTVLDPELEKTAVERLGLKVETVSTQVIPRDRYAKIIQIGSRVGSALERFGVEIRHLQHSDINEAQEGFSKKQKGSSTMPHKKNPISSENIGGVARVLRSHSQVALENTLLWHERDISHSSAERMMMPDHFGLLAYALKRMNGVAQNLVIQQEVAEAKVKNRQELMSSFYLHELIRQTNIRRENLYRLVQDASFAVIEDRSRDLKQELVQRFPEYEIDPAKVTLPDSRFETIKAHYQKRFDLIWKRYTIKSVGLKPGRSE